MAFVISKKVSEFTSDTIQTTSENTALPKKQTLFQLFLQFFRTLERTLSSSFELSQCLKVKAGTLQINSNEFFLHLASHKRLVYNGKKKKKVLERVPPQGAHVLASATTRWRKATRCFLLQTILSNTYVCVIRSLSLSHIGLGLLVSPRSQQQLHSCGVAFARGQNESSVAITLYIEGEGGTHHSSKKRKRGEHKGNEKTKSR